MSKSTEDTCAVDTEEILFNLVPDTFHAPLPDSLFGMTYFTEADIDVIDDETSEVVSQHIAPGTIHINTNVFFMRNASSENNTIIHARLHWDRHRSFFELQKLLNPDLHAKFFHVSKYAAKLRAIELGSARVTAAICKPKTKMILPKNIQRGTVNPPPCFS